MLRVFTRLSGLYCGWHEFNKIAINIWLWQRRHKIPLYENSKHYVTPWNGTNNGNPLQAYSYSHYCHTEGQSSTLLNFTCCWALRNLLIFFSRQDICQVTLTYAQKPTWWIPFKNYSTAPPPLSGVMSVYKFQFCHSTRNFYAKCGRTTLQE